MGRFLTGLGDVLASAATGTNINRADTDRNAAMMQANVRYRDMQEQEAFYNASLLRSKAVAADRRQNAISNLARSLVGKGIDPDLATALATGGVDSPDRLETALSAHDKRTIIETLNDPTTPTATRTTLSNLAALTGLIPNPISAVGGAIVDRQALPSPGAAPTAMTPMQQAQLANVQAEAKQHNAAAQVGGAPENHDAVTQAAMQYFMTGQTPNLGFGAAGNALRQSAIATANGWLRNGVPPDVQPIMQHFGQNILGWRGAQGGVSMMSHGPNLASVEAADTFANHLQLMPQAVAALQSGNIQLVNHFASLFGIQTGQAPAAVAQALSNKLVAEGSAALFPNGSAVHGRERLESDFNLTKMSPEQAQSIGSLYTQLVGAKTEVIEQQYVGSLEQAGVPATQAQDMFRNRLTPTARTAFGLPLSTEPAKQTSAEPSVPTTAPAVAVGPSAPTSGSAPQGTTAAPGGTPIDGSPGAQPPAGATTAPAGAQPPTGAVNADEAALQAAAARWSLPPQAPRVPVVGTPPVIGVPQQ